MPHQDRFALCAIQIKGAAASVQSTWNSIFSLSLTRIDPHRPRTNLCINPFCVQSTCNSIFFLSLYKSSSSSSLQVSSLSHRKPRPIHWGGKVSDGKKKTFLHLLHMYPRLKTIIFCIYLLLVRFSVMINQSAPDGILWNLSVQTDSSFSKNAKRWVNVQLWDRLGWKYESKR